METYLNREKIMSEKITPTDDHLRRISEAAELEKSRASKMGKSEDGTYILVETDQTTGDQTVVCNPLDNNQILRFAHPKMAEGWVGEWGEEGYGYGLFKAVGGFIGTRSKEALERKLKDAQEPPQPVAGLPAKEVVIVHHELQSSNIFSAGHDPINNVLEIKFRVGGLYRYFDVPEEIATELVRAESPGGYFHAKIKGGGYKYERVE